MSSESYTADCPRCGGVMECGRDTRVFETVYGDCDECGFEYHTIASLLSLTEVNKIRAEIGKEPISERKPPQGSWTSKFTGDED